MKSSPGPAPAAAAAADKDKDAEDAKPKAPKPDRAMQQRLSDILAKDLQARKQAPGATPQAPANAVDSALDTGQARTSGPKAKGRRGKRGDKGVDWAALERDENPPTLEDVVHKSRSLGEYHARVSNIFTHVVSSSSEAKEKEKLGGSMAKLIRGDEGAHAGSEAPLSEVELYSMATSHVIHTYGLLPRDLQLSLIDSEFQQLLAQDIPPTTARHFRTLRQGVRDTSASASAAVRGHPRARGMCQLSGNQAPPLHHANTNLLVQYLTAGGQLKPGRVTGVSALKQRELARAVKRARQLGLLSYVDRLPIPQHPVNAGRSGGRRVPLPSFMDSDGEDEVRR